MFREHNSFFDATEEVPRELQERAIALKAYLEQEGLDIGRELLKHVDADGIRFNYNFDWDCR